MEDYVVNVIIVGFISWTFLFILVKKLLPNRSFDFCSRIVSTCHAILGVILASLSIQDWNCPVCPPASSSSSAQMKILAVSMGYFIYDLICSQFDEKSSNLDNFIHHLVCIIGLAAGLSYQKCGTEMVAALWIAELSTPFLHLRELLKELGYRDTDLNLAADVAFAVMFSLGRMVGGPYLTYVLVCAFWFYKILRMVQNKLTKRASLVRKTPN
ncbi:hypothetical protein V2J09_007584 [Rumex salicifolius]